MKKKKLSDMNLISVIGQDNIKDSIFESRPLYQGVEQYILLCKSLSTASGYHSGIISMLKVSYDDLPITLFSITRTLRGWGVYTTNPYFKFYTVRKNGTEYVAIKKTNLAMNVSAKLLSFHYHPDSKIFMVEDAKNLTDITPIS